MDELHDALALANAVKAMHESGDDAWRVLDVLGDHLLSVINRLDEISPKEA